MTKPRTRLEHLTSLRQRIEHEIAREVAFQRRAGRLETDARLALTRTSRDDIERLLRYAAHEFDVTLDVLLGRSRVTDAVRARHVAAWLLRDAGLTYPEIGRRMRRDHTTAIASVARCDSDERLIRAALAVKTALACDEEAVA